jgi:hypothetical protein
MKLLHSIMKITLLAILLFGLLPAIGYSQKPVDSVKNLHELHKVYREAADRMWSEMLKVVSEEDRSILKGVEVQISLKDIPFAFWAMEDQLLGDKIELTVGGLRTVSMCTLAIAMSTHSSDKTWFLDYAYYVRRELQRRSTFILDPTKAAGVSSDNIPEAVLDLDSKGSGGCTLFILAHEAAHILKRHSRERKEAEGDAAYYRRLRNQEEEADSYACNVMIKMRIPPAISVYTFLAMHLIFDEPNANRSRAEHPSNAQRIKAAIVATLENFDNVDWGGQDPGVVRRNLRALLPDIRGDQVGTLMNEVERKYRGAAGLKGRISW